KRVTLNSKVDIVHLTFPDANVKHLSDAIDQDILEELEPKRKRRIGIAGNLGLMSAILAMNSDGFAVGKRRSMGPTLPYVEHKYEDEPKSNRKDYGEESLKKKLNN